MKCYFTLIHRNEWERLGKISALLVSHNFRHAELSYGDTQTYESTKSAEDVEIFVRHLLAWLDAIEIPAEQEVPTWSFLATSRTLASEQSPRSLPRWVLAEFFNSILLDEEAFARLANVAPDLAGQFEPKSDLRLYIYKRRPRQRHERVDHNGPTQVPIEQFSNDPHGEPQVTSVRAEGFRQLVSLAHSAYRDLRINPDRGLGGLNALVLLSAEENHLPKHTEPEGKFALYNLSALGLRYSQNPDSLASLLVKGRLEVLHITAEPADDQQEDTDELSSSR